MANMHSRYKGGNLVFWDTHRHRIVDAIGPDVIKYELKSEHLNASGTDPDGWTSTVVETATGTTTEFNPSDTAGIIGRIASDVLENDGGSYQLLGSNYEFTSNQHLVYAGVELAINDVDQTDLFFGYAVTDTALLGGVADAVYLESLDGSASVTTVTEKNSTETSTTSAGTLVDAQFHTLELYFDGSSVYFYFDGSQAAIHTANIPDDVVLRPSIEFLNGEAAANTCDIRWMRFLQVGRT